MPLLASGTVLSLGKAVTNPGPRVSVIVTFCEMAVADAGTVTKAARLLHLEQPAVSRQLKLLETELGLTLFDRSPNGMVLTDSGEVLVGYARRAVAELEKAEAELRALKERVPALQHEIRVARLADSPGERHAQ